MKTYLRILSYATNLVPRLIQFLIFSVLGTIFSVTNIVIGRSVVWYVISKPK